MNALSHAVRQGLMDAIGTLTAAKDVTAAILICEGRTFMAGADIKEFGKPAQPPAIYEVAAAFEALRVPTIAAIHGSALGGGLEVALGCDYRIATESAKFGFPEVTLGVIPGSGGIVRSVRCLSPETAVSLITGDKPVSAEKARDIKLIDDITDGDLLEAAMAFARGTIEKRTPLSQRPTPSDPGTEFWEQAKGQVRKSAKGSTAPLVALETIRMAYAEPFEDARRKERTAFEGLRDGDQARALRHVFQAERRANRPAALKNVTPPQITSAGVVGGGTMGAGIAAALLQNGLKVTLLETSAKALEGAEKRVQGILVGAAKRGLLSASAHDECLARFDAALDMSALSDCDLVIEAVFEDMAIKQTLFANLEAVVRPDTLLATNTSYLNPADIAQGLKDKSRFIGLHFFSPAHVMKLLEIVTIDETSPETLAAGFALAQRLGKIAVQAGICEGFIGNRLLKRYRVAAEKLVADGVPIAQVDAAAKNFGLAMGPFAAQDLGGLDIAFRQREAARTPGVASIAPLADALCNAGRLGQKTGGGWYDYADGATKPLPSSAVDAILSELSVTPQSDPADLDDIADRLFFPMIDEATQILAEGIAKALEDIDLVEIHGYGFPRWRGGLMFYAQTLDRKQMFEKLERLGIPPSPAFISWMES